MLNFFKSPYLLLILPPLFWSGNMVAGRFIHEQIAPFTLSFVRWSIVLLLLLPFILKDLRQQFSIVKNNLLVILILSLLGIVAYNSLAYIALKYTTATNTSLLNSFIPIVTILLSWLFYKKSLTRLQFLGVFISFTGVLAIISHGQLSQLLHLEFNRGDLWMLAAVIVWATYTLGLSYRPNGLTPLFLLAIMSAFGLIFLFPLMIYELMYVKTWKVDWQSSLIVLYIGIFPGFVGQFSYNQGVKMVGANQASLFIHLMPIFAAVLSYIFLGELLQAYHFIGIFLILIGIFLTIMRFTSLSLKKN